MYTMSRNCGDSAARYARNKTHENTKWSHITCYENKIETKEESKQGHTHQVCHSNHKINTSDKKLYLTTWRKNGSPKVSYQFKTLSLKLAADASNYGVRDSDVLLQKQPSEELYPVPQGHTSRPRKVKECCHAQKKKKGYGSYDGSYRDRPQADGFFPE